MVCKHRSNTGKRTAAAIAAGVFVLAAGNASMGMPTAKAAEPAEEVFGDDITLEAFSEAYARVERVRQQYAPAMEQAQSRQQRRQLMHQAHRDMREAIEAEGLTLEAYSRASLAVREDPELKRDVRDLLETNR